jgi:hypothetical protein
VRWLAPGSTTRDASGLDGQPPDPVDAALSLPARHPNGSAHLGQPVPTYSTVSLAVWPHVVTVSVPPGGVYRPRNSEKTSRLPGKKERNPVAQLPDVYMPPQPAADVDSGCTVPTVPVSGMTHGIPRQMGSDGVGVRVGVGLRVPLPLRLPVGVPDGVRRGDGDAVGGGVSVEEADGGGVGDGDCVGGGVPPGVPVRDGVPDGVRLDDGLSDGSADTGSPT